MSTSDKLAIIISIVAIIINIATIIMNYYYDNGCHFIPRKIQEKLIEAKKKRKYKNTNHH